MINATLHATHRFDNVSEWVNIGRSVPQLIGTKGEVEEVEEVEEQEPTSVASRASSSIYLFFKFFSCCRHLVTASTLMELLDFIELIR